MLSRTSFREHGSVVPTQSAWRRWASVAAWPAFGVMALLSLLAVGAHIDAPDELQAEHTPAELLHLQAFEAGRIAERQAAAQLLVKAYRQGWRDAQAEAQRKGSAAPSGLQAGAAEAGAQR